LTYFLLHKFVTHTPTQKHNFATKLNNINKKYQS